MFYKFHICFFLSVLKKKSNTLPICVAAYRP